MPPDIVLRVIDQLRELGRTILNARRKRDNSASSSGVMCPRTCDVRKVSAAAFQSPERARQKTRAVNVGAIPGAACSSAQACVSSPVNKATSNLRRNRSAETTAPLACSKARACSNAPISNSLSTRAINNVLPPAESDGASASANSRVNNRPCNAGKPSSLLAATADAISLVCPSPHNDRGNPVTSGASKPTESAEVLPRTLTETFSGNAPSCEIAGSPDIFVPDGTASD